MENMVLKNTLLIILILFLNIRAAAQQAGEKINSIFVDEFNSQWIGTNTCLLRKNGNSWTAYLFSERPLRINDIKKTNQKIPTLWLATSDGPISLEYNKRKIYNIIVYDSLKTTFKSNDISSITFDDSNTGYFTTFKGIGIFSSLGWRFYTRLIDITKNEYTSAGFKNDTVYLGTNGEGVARIFRKADAFSGASSYVRPWSSLPDDTINCILIDKLGNQWYGTNKGLCRHYTTEPKDNWDRSYNNKLPGKKITSLNEDHFGNIWVGTIKGLVRIEKNSNELTYWTSKDGLISDTINTIFVSGDQSVWIGTNRGISHFDGNKFSNLRLSDFKDKISYTFLNKDK
jgi:ligand-binding sensor domain-containing protein